MIDRFLTYIEVERRYSPLTVRNYRHDIELFAKWWQQRHNQPHFDVAEVSSDDIREWIVMRGESTSHKASSINRELSSLRSFMRYMRKIGVINKDTFRYITSLRTSRTLPNFVPESRMQTVLENIRHESHQGSWEEQRRGLIVAILYGCGLRLAELCSLRTSSIDNGTIRVVGKGNKERIVPLLPELAERIDRYIASVREAGVTEEEEFPLILSKRGGVLSRSTIQRIVAAELGEASVQGKRSPHVLRHTFATHLLNRSADMRDIQELMGHSSLNTTQHYTHNNIAGLQRVYAQAHPHSRSNGADSQ